MGTVRDMTYTDVYASARKARMLAETQGVLVNIYPHLLDEYCMKAHRVLWRVVGCMLSKQMAEPDTDKFEMHDQPIMHKVTNTAVLLYNMGLDDTVWISEHKSHTDVVVFRPQDGGLNYVKCPRVMIEVDQKELQQRLCVVDIFDLDEYQMGEAVYHVLKAEKHLSRPFTDPARKKKISAVYVDTEESDFTSFVKEDGKTFLRVDLPLYTIEEAE